MPIRTQTIALRILAILMIWLGFTVWKAEQLRQHQRGFTLILQRQNEFDFSEGPAIFNSMIVGPEIPYQWTDDFWIELAFSWKSLSPNVRHSWLIWADKDHRYPLVNGQRYLFKILAWKDLSNTERTLVSNSSAFMFIERPMQIDTFNYGWCRSIYADPNLALLKSLSLYALSILFIMIFIYHLYLRRALVTFRHRFSQWELPHEN